MKCLLFLIILVSPFNAFCQFGGQSEIHYYDEKSRFLTDSSKCFYYSLPYSRKGEDTLYTHYCKNRSIRTMTVMKDGLSGGTWEEYYENGILKEKGICEKGRPMGKLEAWYRDGSRESVIEYVVDEPIKMHHYWDSTGVQRVKNGEGIFNGILEESMYDSAVQVGRIRNFRKDSTWIGVNKGRTEFTEEYEHGVLVKGTSFDKEGKTYSYNKVEIAAEMEGGLPELYKFVGQNLKYPMKARRLGHQGTVFISFVVEKDGALENVQCVKGVSKECDAEALRVVKLLPSWTPMIIRGQKVKCKYVLPVKFKLSS